MLEMCLELHGILELAIWHSNQLEHDLGRHALFASEQRQLAEARPHVFTLLGVHVAYDLASVIRSPDTRRASTDLAAAALAMLDNSGPAPRAKQLQIPNLDVRFLNLH